jgi:hypothetical protein
MVQSMVVEPAVGGHPPTTTTHEQRSPSARNNIADIEPSISSKESSNTSDRWAELMTRREERRGKKIDLCDKKCSVLKKDCSWRSSVSRLMLKELKMNVSYMCAILMVRTVNANNDNNNNNNNNNNNTK